MQAVALIFAIIRQALMHAVIVVYTSWAIIGMGALDAMMLALIVNGKSIQKQLMLTLELVVALMVIGLGIATMIEWNGDATKNAEIMFARMASVKMIAIMSMMEIPPLLMI
jgi:hypothetical protein